MAAALSEKLQEVLDIVSETSAADLAVLPQEILQYLVRDLTPADRLAFMFAKNIKVFGGINNYVNDFFAKGTLATILAMSSEKRAGMTASVLEYLNKMATYADLSGENRARVMDAVAQFSPRSGGGNTHRSSRRQRRRRHQRRRTHHRRR